MIRSRDFILFVCIVLFLLFGIASTSLFNESEARPVADDVVARTQSDLTISAEVVSNSIDRESRITELRRKIAERGGEITMPPADMLLEAADDPEVSEESEHSETEAEVYCPNVRDVTFLVPPGTRFEEREGARLLVTSKEELVEQVVGSSTQLVSEIVDTVVLQLPARKLPLAGTSCIDTDVVGIALDGSLIRNNEASVYGIFGSETLIGYALDGFPMYGSYQGETDECGGAVVLGQYNYYLSAEREAVLGCYSGIPVRM